MAISFQQAAAMSLESVQIGFMPPAAAISAENVLQLVTYSQAKGFDFLLAPVNSPDYRRVLFESEQPQSDAMRTWRAGLEAFRPEDLVLRTAGTTVSAPFLLLCFLLLSLIVC